MERRSGKSGRSKDVFGIWMSDGNQLPPAGETACPTYFAKRLNQQGGAGGFACRSNGHNQWSASNDEQMQLSFVRELCEPKVGEIDVAQLSHSGNSRSRSGYE